MIKYKWTHLGEDILDPNSRHHVRAIDHGTYELSLEGKTSIVHVYQQGLEVWTCMDGIHRKLVGQVPTFALADEEAKSKLHAPLTATVLESSFKVGDEVAKGTCLVKLEAMKMEYQVKTNQQARIKAIYAKQGTVVQEGTLLVELELIDHG